MDGGGKLWWQWQQAMSSLSHALKPDNRLARDCSLGLCRRRHKSRVVVGGANNIKDEWNAEE